MPKAFIPGEYQKGVHTVDFLIWIPDYQAFRRDSEIAPTRDV